MAFLGLDPGDPNNWYQSPHLGLFPASPAACGGGISGRYYNSPYHSYGNSTCAFTQFSSPPNPYPPLQLNPSATIINGHLFPHQFPFVAQQPLTTTPRDPYIPTYHSPPSNPNPWIYPSISYEPSISSVNSHFISTKTMRTPPVYHSAPSIPTFQSPSVSTFVPQLQFTDPKPPPLHSKPFRGFKCRVVMGAKARVAKKSRNPDLLRDVGKYSRSKRYHRCGLWVIKARNGEVFPRHKANAAVAIMEELHQLLVGQKTPITAPTSRPLKFGSLPAPMVAASLIASGRTSSSATAIAGGSIRISEPNFNLSPHKAILDLNDDISVVVVSGSSSEDNIVVGMTAKLVLNVDKNTAGGGTGMKFSDSHGRDGEDDNEDKDDEGENDESYSNDSQRVDGQSVIDSNKEVVTDDEVAPTVHQQYSVKTLVSQVLAMEADERNHARISRWLICCVLLKGLISSPDSSNGNPLLGYLFQALSFKMEGTLLDGEKSFLLNSDSSKALESPIVVNSTSASYFTPSVSALVSVRMYNERHEPHKEFTFDLVHNQYRPFQGLNCLMQISTSTEDFIIDTLKLGIHNGPYPREVFNAPNYGPHLREVFKEPPKRKVRHGAGRDIGRFQHAFGIYICNLFDTGQASRVLKLERNILDYLLNHFCDVSASKEYQNTNGYDDHTSSSQSIIANIPSEFQCPKSGQKLIHMALTPNYALMSLLHQCSKSWIITIIFIFFCISVEKAIADTMKLTSEFLVGCLAVIPAIKKYLNDKIEPWLAGIFCENGFLHDSDSKWGGIVTGKKLADLGADSNDHHYHLGYFIYVVPVTSKIDLAWGKKYMSQAYSLGQKLNIQQGSSYFGIVPVILKDVFNFSSEMHCFSLVTIIFNVGMVTTMQPFSRDWGFQVHQLWPPLMMMRCFSLPLSLLGNDYLKSTLLITVVTGFDMVALHFLYQTKASCHPRSFIVGEFFDFLKSNSKLSLVRYTCDALLSSDNCVGFLTNMHKFFQHMVGHVHKDEFFMATCSSTSCPPFHALVKKLFLLSLVVAIHSLQPLLADILRDDAQLIFGILMVVSMNELMFLRSKKQGLQIGYSDIDYGNYCPSMSCSLHLPHFMITWFFEFTFVAIDFGDLALIPPQYFSVPIRTNEAPSFILLFRVVHSQAIDFVNSSHILQGPNREALRTSATSHVGVHLCALLHTWQVTNDENEATAVAFALINSVVAVCIQLSSCKAAFGTDIYVASVLIDMYSKCGLSLNFQEKEAFTYFEKMRQYEMFPTPFSYANLLSCCAKLASSSQEKQITTLTLMKISLAKVFEIESDGGLSHNLEKMCLLIVGHDWAADVISSDFSLLNVDDLVDQFVALVDFLGLKEVLSLGGDLHDGVGTIWKIIQA